MAKGKVGGEAASIGIGDRRSGDRCAPRVTIFGEPPFAGRRKDEELAGRWPLNAAHGVSRCRELFCVPILISFSDEISESWLESVLRIGSRHLNLQAEVGVQLIENGLEPLVVLEEFLPMSGIKAATLQQARSAVRVRSTSELRSAASVWSRKPDTPMRRFNTFLFYVLGLHVAPCSEDSFTDGAECNRLGVSIARFVGDAFGSVVAVRAKLFRGFFNGLFDGIWMYQDARLSQIAARAKACASSPSARIDVEVGSETHQIVLQLSSEPTAVSFAGRFRVVCRPSDDPSASVARVESTLKRAGITQISVGSVASREECVGGLLTQRSAAARLSMHL